MADQLYLPVPMSRAQLRRLQALWHRWTGSLRLGREADRELRHYYIERFTHGRAKTTKELTSIEAARVIERLERLAESASAKAGALDRADIVRGRRCLQFGKQAA